MQTYIGIDWGGTFLKAGIVSSNGKILKKTVFSSQDLSKKKLFFARIREIVKESERFSPAGLGLGIPGIVDLEKGSTYYLPNVPGWKNYPIKRELEKACGLDAAIDNDANLFALSEARIGAAAGVNNALFLTLGTGLGGAVMIDRKIVKGRTSAGEVGHVPVEIKGKACSCGGRGCVETFTGNRHLIRKYNRIQKNKKLKVKEVKSIYERALENEKSALAVWEEFSLGLGVFISGMINVFNPEMVVFGGGVSGAFKVFKPMLMSVIRSRAMAPQVKGLKLVKAKVKDAGIIGAALLAKESLE